MRGFHGRPAGSGETATIKDAIRSRAARLQRQQFSSGASPRRVPQESKGVAHRLGKEQQGSGRFARVKD
jgi:hypothetical protein